MDFDLSDAQKMLFDTASRFFTKHSPSERLRQLVDQGEEWDEPLWREMAEMGFLGVAIPEEYGGLGLSSLDQGMISEALGQANASVPYHSSAVLAAQALLLAGSEAQKLQWLPRLATGEVVATFASDEGLGAAGDWDLQTRVKAGRLYGTKQPVQDGGVADLAIVVANASEDENQALYLVELDGDGVARERLNSFDELRACYALTFEEACCERLGNASADTLDKLFDRAAIQAAFEGVGGAVACLNMARDYAMERQIFGRQLASYQAIKHKLADILVSIELARSSTFYAAWCADHTATAAAAAAARLLACEAFAVAARENMQVHGGISYTFEADCHFYYRRERGLALSLGGPEYWAERLTASVTTPTGTTL